MIIFGIQICAGDWWWLHSIRISLALFSTEENDQQTTPLLLHWKSHPKYGRSGFWLYHNSSLFSFGHYCSSVNFVGIPLSVRQARPRYRPSWTCRKCLHGRGGGPASVRRFRKFDYSRHSVSLAEFSRFLANSHIWSNWMLLLWLALFVNIPIWCATFVGQFQKFKLGCFINILYKYLQK